ncbi:sugar phosphate isomerase/epimerase family protein [Scatolibacter rhodanostii]|uniref:sugar phosphate isomerase/epimerase family protein n=1 Tax=Scatolibacter rhodanostii TaxID=2014781 RepID=UPI000C0845A8|nr:TIM barrel protein [Scatolibacter rhodanostii]
MEEVYIQTATYSWLFREKYSTAIFNEYLERTAKMGYTGVEFFGNLYGDQPAQELKKVLKDFDLKVIGAHVSMDEMDGQMEYLADLGAKYMICPGVSVHSHEEALAIAEKMNKYGEKAKTFGLKYGYHNHNNDFDKFEGETVLETFLSHTDPTLVGFEFDVGWIWRAGYNAADLVQKYAGRVPLIHVKETNRMLKPDESAHKFMENAEKDEKGNPILTPEIKAKINEFLTFNCKLGEGLINIPHLKPIADAQGTEAYIVEREYAYTGDVFTSVQEDLDYLRNI